MKIKSIFDIVEECDLQWALKAAFQDNKAVEHPYHNFYHTQTVAEFAYAIGKAEGLGKTDLLHLVVAGLFHDFNHSGGKYKDDVNVDVAKRKMMSYNGLDDRLNYEIVKDLINNTEFPYKVPTKALPLIHKVLRDADMMQSVQHNMIQQCLIGLCAERKVDFTESIPDQIKFLKSVEFHTVAAQEYTKDKLPEAIKNLEMLAKIVKSDINIYKQ